MLEIGPGGTPFHRSDIFLDIEPGLFESDEIAGYQRGNAPKLNTDKPIIYYDGKKFPFNDKEFDYVICSHVLEHVESPNSFLREVYRVGKKGYLEFPTIYYDYVFNIPVHVNLLYFNGRNIKYLKKESTPLDYFKAVQDLYLDGLSKGYVAIVEEFKEYMFQGFEWTERKQYKAVAANNINEIISNKVLEPMTDKTLPAKLKHKNKILSKVLNRLQK